MKEKIVSRIMLTLLMISMLTFVFNIHPVRADGTIYIRLDGTVEGTDKIQRDGDVYTFTDNIYDTYGIVVERDNIAVDGASNTLQGTGSGKGILLSGRSNVTIKNMEIKAFDYGIYLRDSSNNTICRNSITNNWGDTWIGGGIVLYWYSNNNTISRNNITNNKAQGIGFFGGSNSNTVSGNNITNNYYYGINLENNSNNKISGNNITANNRSGIYVVNDSNNNTISGNSITAHNVGIIIEEASDNTVSGNTIINNGNGVFIDSRWFDPNKLCHNNFINNAVQAHTHHSVNHIWDDGYPSGGNYWSDHVTIDDCCGVNQDEPGSDGIGDIPYIIDENNVDNYPLMATSDAIDHIIQSLPSSKFDKPEEDVTDIKNDFADKFADVEENIDEENYERAIEHLIAIKEFALEQIVESAERQEIILMTDSLIAYLENFLSLSS